MNFLQAVTSHPQCPNKHLPSPLLQGISSNYYQFIFQGTQEDSSGPVKFSNVEHLCKFLNRIKTADTSFDIDKIKSGANGIFNFKGNTSTAMALDFIDRYIFLSNNESPRKDPEEIFKRMRLRYHHSCFVFRARQAAFNTLYKTVNTARDFYRSQLSCLLMFHQRRSMWSSKSIEVKARNFRPDIEETFKKLRSGDYILRMDKPSPDGWEEETVHTVVLIKHGKNSYFYDPKFGCLNLVETTEHLFLQLVILKYQEIYGIDTVRFFEIAEKLVRSNPFKSRPRLPKREISSQSISTPPEAKPRLPEAKQNFSPFIQQFLSTAGELTSSNDQIQMPAPSEVSEVPAEN